MIVLNLTCAAGHRFEGWFASGEAFDRQVEQGLVACPYCNIATVSRLPSGPHVARKILPPETTGRDEAKAVLDALKAITDNTEDVGHRFPEEVRRIHYREVPDRSLRGVATLDETRDLLEEGIPVLPLPIPPKRETH